MSYIGFRRNREAFVGEGMDHNSAYHLMSECLTPPAQIRRTEIDTRKSIVFVTDFVLRLPLAKSKKSLARTEPKYQHVVLRVLHTYTYVHQAYQHANQWVKLVWAQSRATKNKSVDIMVPRRGRKFLGAPSIPVTRLRNGV